MPFIRIQTNRSIDHSAEKPLMSKLSQQAAKLLGKPERYVMVELVRDCSLIFAGDNQPAAYVELKSIGLSEDQTQPLSEMICTLLQHELMINPDRVYIEFSDCPRKFWGWNSSTF